MQTEPGINTLQSLATALDRAETTAEQLVAASLASIERQNPPDNPVFLHIFTEQAMEAARDSDRARARGEARSQWEGIPFAVKDLFDIKARVTHAGARVTAEDPPASVDAEVVAALKDRGMVLIGTTNMTEFAFSGLGLNPHYGTPEAAPWPGGGHAPGGSSSGAGVSVALGTVPLSLGTDTAGSCRIPAAWNSVVGFKPSQYRLSRNGIFPLSHSLDTPGPLANSVACCRTAEALMRCAEPGDVARATLASLEFTVPDFDFLPELDSEIETAFSSATNSLQMAGARVRTARVSWIEKAVEAFLTHPIAGYEAWLLHRERLAARGDEYDPNVARRLRAGGNVDVVAQAEAVAERRALADAFRVSAAPGNFYLLPTTANTPPIINSLQSDDAYFATANLRALTYTSVANYLDACAISLPVAAGVGLSVMGPNGTDSALLSAADTIEATLAQAVQN